MNEEQQVEAVCKLLRHRLNFINDEWWMTRDGTRAAGIVVHADNIRVLLAEIDRLTALAGDGDAKLSSTTSPSAPTSMNPNPPPSSGD